MEPNRNVDRLKYLINDHSIINQEKLSLPVDKWEKNNLNRIPKCSTVLVLLTNLFYIKAEKKKKRWAPFVLPVKSIYIYRLLLLFSQP